MSQPALKCENNASIKQIYILKGEIKIFQNSSKKVL